MNEFYALLTGLLLRFGIPILFTGGLVYLLARLDARWQQEAVQQKEPAPLTDQKPCWEQKDCPPGQVQACPAASSSEPCWQVFRQNNGYLAQKCLDCQVFSSAPAPAKS
jgi:hypothetical protein